MPRLTGSRDPLAVFRRSAHACRCSLPALAGARRTGRALGALLSAIGVVVCAVPAFAEPPALLRYQPPPVDFVYPLTSEPLPEQKAPPAPELRAPPAQAPVQSAEPTPSSTPEAALPPDPAVQPAPTEYGARAQLTRPKDKGRHRLALAATRDVPGSLGDPLRVLDALPGVVPLTSGLPYVYIRGAPPAGQGFVYDEIPLPQLFHAAFGPAILHPRATGSVQLSAGIPDARYGRRVGGFLVADGEPQKHEFSSEFELRLIDLGGFVETPVGAGVFTVSGRIGYPKLGLLAAEALGILDDGSALNYGDGQVRFRYPLGPHETFELVWLGSFDDVNLPGLSNDPRAGASRLHFQRIETRLVHTTQRGEVGSALRFGYDQSELGTALTVRAFTFGPRVWATTQWGRHALRVGAELYGSKGDIHNRGGVVASPDGDLRVNLPTIAEAPARNQGGAYAQGRFLLGEDTTFDLGVRFDYWSVSSKITLAVDPRIRVTHELTPELALHAAFGTTHQPAVFLLPTPGLTDVALDRGLMRSLQAELGVDYQLTRSTHVAVQGYLHHYENLLLLELVRDGEVPEDPPLVSANAYGIEAFLRRDMTERLAGWISYTLGFAIADNGDGVIGRFRPDFDVRHVFNTVLSYRVWRGLTVAGRFQARSGRIVEQLNPSYTQRLPWFVRADARVGYGWDGRFARMTAYLEWLNVFVQREYTDIDCLLGACRAQPAPVIALPNLGVRAEF